MTAETKKIGHAFSCRILSAVVSLSLVVCFAEGKSASAASAAEAAQETKETKTATKTNPRLMLSAAVIRYDQVSQKMTKDQWHQVMEEISALDIKTIIIQHHHLVPRQTNGPAQTVELDFLPGGGNDFGMRKPADSKLSSPTPRSSSPAPIPKPSYPAPAAKIFSRSQTSEAPSSATAKSESALSKTAPDITASSAQTHNKPSLSHGAVDRVSEETVDASGIILDYADVHHMNVYLGLWMDINWYGNLDVMDQLANNLSRSKLDLVQLQNELTNKKANPSLTPTEINDAEAELAVCKRGLESVRHEMEEKSEYFAANKDGQLAGPSLTMADKISKLYGQHPSFVGWYLPEEIWDAAFSHETVSVLNPLLKFIRDHCREVSSPAKRMFAMSPYASRLHYDSVDAIVAAQQELLKDTGVDVLMLQDSIGDLNLKEDEDIAVRLKKHFTAFSKVAAALKMKLWAELETFEQVGSERKPATISRFKKQFQYSYPYLDKSDPLYVAFDYLHYLSLTDAKFPYAEERGKLYDDYKREFVDGRFTPPPARDED